MSADTLLPDSDILTAWSSGTGSTNAEINDGSDGSYIATASNNGVSRFGFDAAPGDFGSLNLLTLRVRNVALNFVDDNDNVDVRLFDAGGQIGATKNFGVNSSITDDDFLDVAWDSLSAAQLNALEVSLTYLKNSSGMPDSGRIIRVHQIEAILDYDAAAPFSPDEEAGLLLPPNARERIVTVF